MKLNPNDALLMGIRHNLVLVSPDSHHIRSGDGIQMGIGNDFKISSFKCTERPKFMSNLRICQPK